MIALAFILYLLSESQWLAAAVPWLAPLLLSGLGGGAAGYGSFRFAQGTLVQRLATVERDAAELRAGQVGLVTRNEFDLLREDLAEIKADVREIRRVMLR